MPDIGEYRRNILYLRCSDGRSRRPEDIRGHCVHQIRLPGGVLNADFCSCKTDTSVSLPDLRELTMIHIRTMVGLKNPDEIILASHDRCGAADALGLSHAEVVSRHEDWKQMLEAEFPDISITVVHEELPVEDETERRHIYLASSQPDEVQEVLPLQEAAQES